MANVRFSRFALYGALSLSITLLGSVSVGYQVSPAHAESSQRAKLVVPDREFGFGTVPQGAKVVHEFELLNKGNAPLSIHRIVPSCGCTAAALTSMTIAPGATEKIRVEFDTAGFSGSKTKTVSVTTNDLDLAEVVFSLKGTVVPGAVASPQRVEFGVISPGAAESSRIKEFEVSIKGGSDLSISGAKTFAKSLTVTEVSKTASGARFRVELDDSAPRGELRDRVIIDFAGGRQPALNVPVTASVRGDLRLVPATVSAGVLDGTTPIERRVRLDNASGKLVEIESVESSDPAVTGKVLRTGKKGDIVLSVLIDPTKAKGDLRATLDIKTDHPEEGTLSLNVFGVQPPK